MINGFLRSFSSQLCSSLQIQVLKFHARAKVCMMFLSSAVSSNRFFGFVLCRWNCVIDWGGVLFLLFQDLGTV